MCCASKLSLKIFFVPFICSQILMIVLCKYFYRVLFAGMEKDLQWRFLELNEKKQTHTIVHNFRRIFFLFSFVMLYFAIIKFSFGMWCSRRTSSLCSFVAAALQTCCTVWKMVKFFLQRIRYIRFYLCPNRICGCFFCFFFVRGSTFVEKDFHPNSESCILVVTFISYVDPRADIFPFDRYSYC